MSEWLTINTEHDFPFEDYYATLSVPNEAKSKLNNTDILIVPTKIKDKFVFSESSIDFIKFSRLHENRTTIDLLADSDDLHTYSFHSAEIILPDFLIFIWKDFLLPILIGLITNYIYDKTKGNNDEDTTVRFSITTIVPGKIKQYKYEGPAEKITEVFNQIEEDHDKQ